MKLKYEQIQYNDSGKELVRVDGYVEREFSSSEQAREWAASWIEWKEDFVLRMGIEVVDRSNDRIVWTGSGITFVEMLFVEE